MPIILDSQYVSLSSGTTAQRPTATNGSVRYNSTTGFMELYDESSWRKVLKGYYGDWAYRGGHSSFASAYKMNYTYGYHSSNDVYDATSNAQGITINKSGYYFCQANGRLAGGDGFVGIALNGDRTALDSSTNDGLWGHDHNGGTGVGGALFSESWSQSYYVGYLAAGNFVTAGYATNTWTSIQLQPLPYMGALLIIKLK